MLTKIKTDNMKVAFRPSLGDRSSLGARTSQFGNLGNTKSRLEGLDERITNLEQVSAENVSQPQEAVTPEMTNVPPPPSNTMGQAKPVFPINATNNAAQMFGNILTRQNAAGVPPLFKKKCNKSK